MKKKRWNPILNRGWRKIFLIMRVSVFFILAGLLHVSASVYSQKTKLQVRAENKSIMEVLKMIEEQSDFHFLYRSDNLEGISVKGIDLHDAKVEDILDKVLVPNGLTYEIEDRTIMIRKSKDDQNQNIRQAPQKIRISGSVKDSKGIVLPGVTIMAKGTTVGTVSDNDGQYNFFVPADAKTLVFSFVGMKSQEFIIGDKTTFNVVMAENTVGLEEIVAIGYGTQRKSDLTGSIATVNMNGIKDLPSSTIDLKLIGQVPGVQVQQVSGAPGGGTSIKIRGNGSVGAGNEPLYVIDGMPYSEDMDQDFNPLIFINPNDIESVSILKDASSTAIYGSRGANGVIIITTKKGEYNRTQINVSSMMGVQQVPQRGRPKMLNVQEFGAFEREKIALVIKSQENRDATVADYPVEYLPENLMLKKGTDWYNLILQTANVQDHNISVLKGSKDSRVNFNLGYYKQEGVLRYTGVERLTGTLTMESNIGKAVKIGATLQPSFVNQNKTNTNAGREDIMGVATWANPVMSPYDANGDLLPYITSPSNKYHSAWSFNNPLFTMREKTMLTKDFQNRGLAFIEWEVVKGLKAKSSINTLYSVDKYFQWVPSTIGALNKPPTAGTGKSTNDRGDSFNWLIENTLTYDKLMGKHKFNALLGYTTQKRKGENLTVAADPYTDDMIQTINAAQAIKSWGQQINEWSMISYLGRMNYSYADKYLLTATFRSDGSSRFGEKNRYASFPSVAAAWRISQEGFLKNSKVLDNLKLRASYGRSGNDNISNYAHLSSVNAGAYIFGANQITASTIGISNPNLTWEESDQIDGGLDLSLFNNRLSFVADYYYRKSRNMLLGDVIPAITGYSSQTVNKGNVRNTGVEFALGVTPAAGKFRWDINLNMAFNHNKVISLNDSGDRLTAGNNDDWPTNVTVVGKPIGQLFGFQFDGLYTAEDLLDPAMPKYPAAVPGAVRYKDINGDGLISDLLDYTIIGNPQPDFTFGFSNSFSFKNFDLSVIVNGQYGGDVVNGLRQTIDNQQGYFNVSKEWVNRWHSASSPGDGKHYGIPLGSGCLGFRVSDLWIEDATYLKIANVTLGYSLPKKMMKNTGFISNCRFYFTVQNLAMFTKYSGANPEAQSANQSNVLAAGFDMTSYPLARTASFGLKLTF